MLASTLPANPSLEQLRKQAKEFRSAVRTGHSKFTTVARQHLPRTAHLADTVADWASFSLADAQLVVARCYGFASWGRLREYLDNVARYSRSPHPEPAGDPGDRVDRFLRLACLTYRSRLRVGTNGGDDSLRHAQAGDMLVAYPDLASANIYTAAAAGDVATARSLLSRDPALADRSGGPYDWPPLLYAALSRLAGPSTVEVAGLLLAAGADPNAGYLIDGEPPPVTALSAAFHGRHDPTNQPAHRHGLALARLLLNAGADPNDERAVGNACGYPHDDAGLALLFEHGLGHESAAPWRARLGRQEFTPATLVQDELRYAAERDLSDRVRLLLRQCATIGIDINTTREGVGRSAHDLAVLGGNTEIADLLAAAGAVPRPLDPADQLVAAAMRVDAPAVASLLAADPTIAERAVRTAWPNPLLQAAFLRRPGTLRLLVSLGFPLNDPRMSPLHLAALAGRLDIVKLLIELGADPSAAIVDDTPGQFQPPDSTPLGWARYNHQDEVAAYLAALPTVDDQGGAR